MRRNSTAFARQHGNQVSDFYRFIVELVSMGMSKPSVMPPKFSAFPRAIRTVRTRPHTGKLLAHRSFGHRLLGKVATGVQCSPQATHALCCHAGVSGASSCRAAMRRFREVDPTKGGANASAHTSCTRVPRPAGLCAPLSHRLTLHRGPPRVHLCHRDSGASPPERGNAGARLRPLPHKL